MKLEFSKLHTWGTPCRRTCTNSGPWLWPFALHFEPQGHPGKSSGEAGAALDRSFDREDPEDRGALARRTEGPKMREIPSEPFWTPSTPN